MLYAFGVGEVPISVSGFGRGQVARCRPSARRGGDPGPGARGSGDVSGCAGRSAPSGGWTLAEGRDLLIVAGGIGLAPLRPVLLTALEQRARYSRVVLLVGARSPHDLLFTRELETWRRNGVEVRVTVDRAGRRMEGRRRPGDQVHRRCGRPAGGDDVRSCAVRRS